MWDLNVCLLFLVMFFILEPFMSSCAIRRIAYVLNFFCSKFVQKKFIFFWFFFFFLLKMDQIGGEAAADTFIKIFFLFYSTKSILYPGNNMYDKYFFQKNSFCIFCLMFYILLFLHFLLFKNVSHWRQSRRRYFY